VGVVADGQAVVFGLPVVAQETAVHDAHHRAAAAARLDEPLEGHERAVRVPVLLRRVVVTGFPGRDAGAGHLAEHVERAGLAGAIDFGAPHEPGVDSRSRRDRRPDLVRRGVDGELLAYLEWMRHSYSSSAGGSASSVMLGCTATTSRCGRPVSVWYLPISPVSASMSSPTNAARSAGFANRTSASSPNVASGWLARAAPLMSVPVSRTSRAASASSQRADSRSGDRAGSGATGASAAGEITYAAAEARTTRSVMLPLRRSSTNSTRPCCSRVLTW